MLVGLSSGLSVPATLSAGFTVALILGRAEAAWRGAPVLRISKKAIYSGS